MTRPLIACPEPGIYRDVPMDAYQSWNAVGNGTLGYMAQTPAHFRHVMDNGTEPTEAMRLGVAAHMAILEPARFAETYRPHIEGSRSTKPVKDDIARIRAEGFEPLRPEEWIEINGWREHLVGDALDMLAAAEAVELSIVWDQKVEGERIVRCKCRADVVTWLDGTRVCNDLKTSRSAAGPAFGRACANYGYTRGAAHYLAGLRAVGLECAEYVFTVFEKRAPYLVAPYRLSEQAREDGVNEWWRLLSMVAECQEKGSWPGYPIKTQIVSVPAWGAREEELSLVIDGETVEV